MKIGIDVVEIERVSKTISKSNEFINKILSPKETEQWNVQSLCGKIAAKEAIIKTGFIRPGDWKKVSIVLSASGEPQVYDENGNLVSKLHISISHTPLVAVAVAIYE